MTFQHKGVVVWEDDVIHVNCGVENPAWQQMNALLEKNPGLGELDSFWESYKRSTDKAIREALKEWRCV